MLVEGKLRLQDYSLFEAGGVQDGGRPGVVFPTVANEDPLSEPNFDLTIRVIGEPPKNCFSRREIPSGGFRMHVLEDGNGNILDFEATLCSRVDEEAQKLIRLRIGGLGNPLEQEKLRSKFRRTMPVVNLSMVDGLFLDLGGDTLALIDEQGLKVDQRLEMADDFGFKEGPNPKIPFRITQGDVGEYSLEYLAMMLVVNGQKEKFIAGMDFSSLSWDSLRQDFMDRIKSNQVAGKDFRELVRPYYGIEINVNNRGNGKI